MRVARIGGDDCVGYLVPSYAVIFLHPGVLAWSGSDGESMPVTWIFAAWGCACIMHVTTRIHVNAVAK